MIYGNFLHSMTIPDEPREKIVCTYYYIIYILPSSVFW